MPRPHPHRLLLVALAAVSNAVLLPVPAAEAKVWFEDLRGDARQGQVVTTTISGCAGNDACGTYVDGAEVFLRPGASRPIDGSEPGLRAIGRIPRDGRLRFRVPSVPSGAYHLATRVRTDGGRVWTTASRTFRVADAPAPSVVRCAQHASANFPDAFTNRRRNIVVGPLSMVGATSKPADGIARFGGDKLPILVASGHRVTIEVPPAARTRGSLFFRRGGGVLTKLDARDGQAIVTFVSCPPAKRTGTRDGTRNVTFWMGFVLADRPTCLPLRIQVDDEPMPHRAIMRLGARRCPAK